MSIPANSETTTWTTFSVSDAIDWVLSPISYFFPKLSCYILDNPPITNNNHISFVIAKKIDVKIPFEIFQAKKIDIVGGKYSFLKPLVFAPKIIEKSQLFELTRVMYELKDNHRFNEITLHMVSFLGICLVFGFTGFHIGCLSSIVIVTASIYFSRRAVFNYDEKAAKLVGFNLAKHSIANQKTSPFSLFFSPSIDQRLKNLDEAEKRYDKVQEDPSLEEFFPTSDISINTKKEFQEKE